MTQSLVKANLFANTLVAIDGAKFKADDTREKNFTRGKLKRRQYQIDESIDRYLYTNGQCRPPGSGVSTDKSKSLNIKSH